MICGGNLGGVILGGLFKEGVSMMSILLMGIYFGGELNWYYKI